MKNIDFFRKIKENIQSAMLNLREDKRLRWCTSVLGFLFALSWVLGYMLQQNGRTCRTVSEVIWMLFALCFVTLVSVALANVLFNLLTKLRERECKSRFSKKEYREWQVFLFYAAVIMLCWIPVFLAYYPSVFAYDADGQFYQFLAHDYSTHHPLLHTLFLGLFFKLGSRMPGSYSAGMALHSIVQMLLMAVAFAYILTILYREKTSWVMRLFLCIFYALFPTNSILALSTTKDVLFSGLVLLYTMKLYQWYYNKKKCTGTFLFVFVMLSVVMLLFRNNAIYAFLVSQPFVFMAMPRSASVGERASGIKEKKVPENGAAAKRYAAVVAVTLLLFILSSIGLKTVTQAQNGSPREMLSIPLQQMARTRVLHEQNISPEIRAELDTYIPSEWVFAAYNPYLADPVKNRAVIHDNPVGFMKTWIRLGLQFPLSYVDAFLENSIGYWYLADTTHSTIYGKGTESGFGYLSTDNRPVPAGCEIIEHSYLPGLRAFMERIVSDNEYQKIPVLSVIFAPAFYWWLLCLYFAFFLYRKEYEKLIPTFFLILYYFTLLLSPAALIRYMYPLVVTVPMMLCLISAKKQENGNL